MIRGVIMHRHIPALILTN